MMIPLRGVRPQKLDDMRVVFQVESYQRIPLEVEGFLVRRVNSFNCELMTTKLFELIRSPRYKMG
jgi:hypothetical protein